MQNKYLSSLRFIHNFIRQIGGMGILLKKAFGVFRKQGFAGIAGKMKHVFYHARQSKLIMLREQTYQKWINLYSNPTPDIINKMQQAAENFDIKPRFSIIMPTFNSNTSWLKEAIESVRGQIYTNWELCIADDASTNPETIEMLRYYQQIDPRIKVTFRAENGHISLASNSAIQMAGGEWMALFDHDDLLAQDALFWLAEMINKNPRAALIYSDEDKVDGSGQRSDPYFKCDWNYQLFLSQNMISHLGVYKSKIVRQIGGFRAGMEGSQDYDLALRFIEQIKPEQILHIPRVLYHWRMHDDSTSVGVDKKPYATIAAQRAIYQHLQRQKIKASVEILPIEMYRVKYEIPKPSPQLTILIPTKNNKKLLERCAQSILEKTDYPNYEIFVVDNNSDEPDTLSFLKSIQTNPKVTRLHDSREFNFSAINNKAVGCVKSEYLCFLNDDTEVISPEWLTEMMALAIQPGVGAVGAKLWYPNDSLQHGGAILGIGGIASHAHKYMSKDSNGYFNRAALLQEFSAVTAACMLVRKKVFEEAGGFDEKNLAITFNDIDLCLKIKTLGYRIVWTPFAELYHHESVSRGDDTTPNNQERFAKELAYMQNKWGHLLQNDPAYSPNLTLDAEDFGLAWPPRISNSFLV